MTFRSNPLIRAPPSSLLQRAEAATDDEKKRLEETTSHLTSKQTVAAAAAAARSGVETELQVAKYFAEYYAAVWEKKEKALAKASEHVHRCEVRLLSCVCARVCVSLSKSWQGDSLVYLSLLVAAVHRNGKEVFSSPHHFAVCTADGDQANQSGRGGSKAGVEGC
jgi:hypothetical protein